MQTVTIDTNKITDINSFHNEFKKVMGFPDFYGMNMDAWIDCVADIGGKMMSEPLNSEEPICIELFDTQKINKKMPVLINNLIECTAVVNHHLINDKIHPNNGKFVVLKFL